MKNSASLEQRRYIAVGLLSLLPLLFTGCGQESLPLAKTHHDSKAKLQEENADQKALQKQARGQLERAIRHWELGEKSQAIELINETLPQINQSHPDYAYGFHLLSLFHRELNQYEKSRFYSDRAMKLRKQSPGERHPFYLDSLHNAGVIANDLGDYTRAEDIYHHLLKRRREIAGTDNYWCAYPLMELGELYTKIGEYQKAIKSFNEALEIFVNIRGVQSAEYANCLRGLATTHRSAGNFDQANEYYTQAMSVYKHFLDKENIDLLECIRDMALVLEAQEKWDRAEELCLQGLERTSNSFGENHSLYGSYALILGRIALKREQFDESEKWIAESLRVHKTLYGVDHPEYANTLWCMAEVKYRTNQYQEAKSLCQLAFEIEKKILENFASFQAESVSTTFSANMADVQPILDCARSLSNPSCDDLYQWVCDSRGVVTEALYSRTQVLESNPEVNLKLNELSIVKRRLSALITSGPGSVPIDALKETLSELNDRKESIEKELARISIPYLEEQKISRTTVAEIQNELVEDQAIVHIIPGQVRLPRNSSPPSTLDAFVLTRDSTKWLQFESPDSIFENVSDWRKAILSGESDLEESIGIKLRNELWTNIEAELPEIKTIFLIPEGQFAFVPFAALPGRDSNSILLKDYTIISLSHPRDICQRSNLKNPDKSKATSLLVMGGVKYNERRDFTSLNELDLVSIQSSTGTRGGSKKTIRRSLPSKFQEKIYWTYLKGTQTEAEEIVRIWPFNDKPTYLSAEQADEESLREVMPNHSHIHIATHGYFASQLGPVASSEKIELNSQNLINSMVVKRNPLLLTGIVCSGANLPPIKDETGFPTGHDGILTAEEIVNLDLRGTRLVVLSACDTGLGHVGEGEGVYGLQRAFKLAGVKVVIGSLWKVDDAATECLMKLFYKKLWADQKTPAEAMREAQLDLWNNFKLIEELSGQRAPIFSQEQKIPQNEESSSKHSITPTRFWAAWVIHGNPMR